MSVLTKEQIEAFRNPESESYKRVAAGWSGFDFRDLLDTIADLDDRVEEELAAHEQIGTMCFEAGASTDDGTSVGAVRGLVARMRELEGALLQIRDYPEASTALLRSVARAALANQAAPRMGGATKPCCQGGTLKL